MNDGMEGSIVEGGEGRGEGSGRGKEKGEKDGGGGGGGCSEVDWFIATFIRWKGNGKRRLRKAFEI